MAAFFAFCLLSPAPYSLFITYLVPTATICVFGT